MGKPNPSAADLATAVVPGTLTGVAGGTAILAPSNGSVLNFTLWGTFSATIQLERSFDGGTTFVPMSRDLVGSAAVFSAPTSLQIRETESGVLYRASCTAFSSGTASYRWSN